MIGLPPYMDTFAGCITGLIIGIPRGCTVPLTGVDGFWLVGAGPYTGCTALDVGYAIIWVGYGDAIGLIAPLGFCGLCIGTQTCWLYTCDGPFTGTRGMGLVAEGGYKLGLGECTSIVDGNAA